MKPVTTLAEYWRREADFRRRLPLIDERTVWSIDTTPNGRPRQCRAEPHPHRSLKAEEAQIRKVCAMLPKNLKRYRRFIWSVWRHPSDHEAVLAETGYSRMQYWRIMALLLHHFRKGAKKKP